MVYIFQTIISQLRDMVASHSKDTSFEIGNLEGTRRYILAMKIREELLQIWNLEVV